MAAEVLHPQADLAADRHEAIAPSVFSATQLIKHRPDPPPGKAELNLARRHELAAAKLGNADRPESERAEFLEAGNDELPDFRATTPLFRVTFEPQLKLARCWQYGREAHPCGRG